MQAKSESMPYIWPSLLDHLNAEMNAVTSNTHEVVKQLRAPGLPMNRPRR